MATGIRLTEEQKAEITGLYASGLSSYKIAARYGCSSNQVIGSLRKAGQAIRPARSYERVLTDAQVNELVNRYQAGESQYGLCKTFQIGRLRLCHYIRQAGEKLRGPEEARLRGHQHPMWKGGVHLRKGYRIVHQRGHPKSCARGYVSEHTLVWEKVHNKSLPQGWIVHHLNGIKTDNRPCNLVALPTRKHIHILEQKAKRIRELEEENRLLRKAMEDQQAIFVLHEN